MGLPYNSCLFLICLQSKNWHVFSKKTSNSSNSYKSSNKSRETYQKDENFSHSATLLYVKPKSCTQKSLKIKRKVKRLRIAQNFLWSDLTANYSSEIIKIQNWLKYYFQHSILKTFSKREKTCWPNFKNQFSIIGIFGYLAYIRFKIKSWWKWTWTKIPKMASNIIFLGR